MAVVLFLPWPDRHLSPNQRVDRRVKAGYVARARSKASELTRKQTRARLQVGADGVALRLTFCPPDARRRDLDNCLASCKAYLDGVAEALGINDHQFRPVTIDWGDPVKGGEVIIDIGDA